MNGNDDRGYNAVATKEEFVAGMFATLFSDEELSDEERNNLCRYLSDCSPVLREAAMEIYFGRLENTTIPDERQ